MKTNSKQNIDKSKIIKILTDHGWEKTDKAKVVSVAELAYKNKEIDLEVEHDPSDDSIIFRILGKKGNLFLVMFFKNKLEEVLKAVIAIQDSISDDNYQKKIKIFFPICPIFVDTGDDLVPLVND